MLAGSVTMVVLGTEHSLFMGMDVGVPSGGIAEKVTVMYLVM